MTAAKIVSLETAVATLNQSLVAAREVREKIEKEMEGVRSEVEREKRGREEAEGKVEEMKKTVAEKNDDIQAKGKMIVKVSKAHFCTMCLKSTIFRLE